MEISNLQKRSALHHRRALHLPRARTTAPGSAPSTTPVPPSADQPPTDTTTTTSDSLVISSVLTRLGIPVDSTTSQQTSSTASATAVPVTSSVTSSSLPTTSSIPTTTKATPVVIFHTTTFSHSHAHTQSPSASAQASNGMNTMTIIGGVGGALGGTILLTVIIGFILRRWRKRKAAFDTSQFKRGAVILDEDENSRGRPRPPTMIERRNMASSTPLLAPSAAYPYSDQPSVPQPFTQQGTSQAQYGAVPLQLQTPSFAAGHYDANPYAMECGQGQGDPFAAYVNQGQGYEHPGYGAPPVPGTHGPGTYAPYGVDPRYPQYHQQHTQQYPPQYQQHGFGQCSAADTASGASLERASSLANPFSPTVPRAAEGSTLSSPAPSNTVLIRGASTRQSAQFYEAPPAYMNSDLLPSTSAPFHVMNPSSDSAVFDTKVVDTKNLTNGVRQS